MMVGQLGGRDSLRDIVENVSAQTHRLYHLGSAKLSRSNLSRINEEKPFTHYEALFGKLLMRCQSKTPAHKFRLTKGAIKLHVGLNHRGNIPEFVTVTEGKTSDIEVGRKVNFPKGSIIAIDRGYNDYAWFNTLTDKGIFFVTRLKSKAKISVVKRHSIPSGKGLTSDQTIKFTGKQTANKCGVHLRRIADIYKSRWDVELFFKWIKQNLKIKSFVGTSKNAVLTQIWIALCVYLLLAFIKFQSKLEKTMQQMLRILQLNLFEKRDLMALLKGDPIIDVQRDLRQMVLV